MGSEKGKIDFQSLVSTIAEIDRQLFAQAGKAVNVSLTLRNWFIGLQIAEYELHGSDRAKYGENLLNELSQELRKKGISNTGRRQLYNYLSFYRVYPQIVRTLPAQLRHLLPAPVSKIQKVRTLSAQFCTQKDHTLVEYALAGMDNRLFVSKYQLELPKKDEIERFLEEQMKEIGYGD